MTALRHDDDFYETPDYIFKDLEFRTGLKFGLDICANFQNKKCENYITDDKYGGILNNEIPENQPNFYDCPSFCNPPRSKNGKVVNKLYDEWKNYNIDIVMMLCWNDLGNNYGKKLVPHIKNGDFDIVENYGKIAFWKEGKPVYHTDEKTGKLVEWPSRLTYFSLWFKKQ